MRPILAIDFGERYIGVALSDEGQTIAFPHLVIDQKKEANWKKQIEILIKEGNVEKVVIGRPVSLKGGTLPITQKTELFGKELASRLNVLVELVDERLSTKLAKNYNKNAKRADAAAAAVFLQNFLDAHQQKK